MGYNKKTIDIVIPCYNEEPNVLSIVNEIDRNFNGLEYGHAFIFVDDGSTDNTSSAIRKLSELRKDIRLVRLSRNFGKEAAITAGLHQCTSDAAIILDGDLQHPPQLIRDMISEWEKGALIVDAVKVRRNKEGMIRKLASAVFNGMFSRLTGIDFAGASDYKLLDKKAIHALNSVNEKTRFFRGLTNWIGLPHHKVEFHVEDRNAGKTKWSWLNLFHLSVDAVASFSKKPLQIVSILGIFTLLFSIMLGIQTLYNKLVGHSVSGFTTVIIVILLVSSVIMISIGIVGIYLSKIYDEVKGRPIYIIDGLENLSKTDENQKPMKDLE
jgi:polyisoprenyl-phosphate glycosyltransferase